MGAALRPASMASPSVSENSGSTEPGNVSVTHNNNTDAAELPQETAAISSRLADQDATSHTSCNLKGIDTATWASSHRACGSSDLNHAAVPPQADQVSEEKMTSRVADTADRFTVEPSRVLQDTQPRCEACRVQSATGAISCIGTGVDTATWATSGPACGTATFDRTEVPFHGGRVSAKTTSGVTDAANGLPAKRRCVMNETEERSEPSAAQSPNRCLSAHCDKRRHVDMGTHSPGMCFNSI
ncbi:hypothetical protein MTO96_023145 [Rhipicephalus appendiculatus]